MKSQAIQKLLKKLPDTPGVYFFIARSPRTRGDLGSRQILYIGKATSLRDRVRSYFSSDIATTRGPLIVKLLEEFDTIDFQQTDSVLEALILEAHLIKKYQPYYNTKEKSDKSFNFVVITKETFPRVLLVRGKELEQMNTDKNIRSHSLHLHHSYIGMSVDKQFGPFPNGTVIKEALVLIRKIFPFRDKCVPCDEQKKSSVIPGLTWNLGIKMDSGSSNQHLVLVKQGIGQCKPCFNRQIGLCPGVCTGEMTKEEYRETIKNIVRFFRGEKKLIIRDLEKRMKALAKQHEFEKAGEIKRQIFALTHIHDIALIKSDPIKDYGLSTKAFRVEAYDIAHFAGKDVVGVMTVVEDSVPNKNEYRKFKIKDSPGVNDTKALKEILRRRFGHDEWQLPNLIVVDGAVAQKNAAENVLAEFGYVIPIVAVTKNEYHKPKNILGDRQFLKDESAILLANNEAHRYAITFHKKLRNKI